MLVPPLHEIGSVAPAFANIEAFPPVGPPMLIDVKITLH
jgi:hypothetical protein